MTTVHNLGLELAGMSRCLRGDYWDIAGDHLSSLVPDNVVHSKVYRPFLLCEVLGTALILLASAPARA